MKTAVVFYSACVFVWAMNIWGGWAEAVYEKNKDSNFMWFWLLVFGVAKTRKNCVKFLKGLSCVGMFYFTLAIMLFFLQGRELR